MTEIKLRFRGSSKVLKRLSRIANVRIYTDKVMKAAAKKITDEINRECEELMFVKPKEEVMYVELGSKVRSMVSGFTGIATSRCEYLNGCVQYGVTPKVGKDGKSSDELYIDEDQIKVIGKGVIVKSKPRGGNMGSSTPSGTMKPGG